MNWKAAIETGQVPVIHPAAMFLIGAFLLISLLLRKAFCGWLCPVGTISEWLWKTGRSAFKRNFMPPRWLDVVLRSFKYVLLGLFLWLVVTMPVPAIEAFLHSPYGLIADVQMLNFFRHLSLTAAIVIGVCAIASIFVKNFRCRYLCPYGALMGLASLVSPVWIRRQPDKCIDCAKCAKACPTHLPVDTKLQNSERGVPGLPRVRGCLPGGGSAGSLTSWQKTCWTRSHPAAVDRGRTGDRVLRSCRLGEVVRHWDSPISPAVYQRLVPYAAEYDHPR